MGKWDKYKKNKDNKKVEDNTNKTNINWYPGHMAKTKREIAENISLIDLVLEIIDARVPYSSKNNDINNLIKNKPKILVMTKKDLCDETITNKWIKHYEKRGYAVILADLLHDSNLNDLMKEINKIGEEINNIRKSKGLKPRKVRILVLGIPNVGKSTLINKLVKKKATNVGNRPGITKHLEWIRINNDLELLDTPGILWPRIDDERVGLSLASTTAVPEEILNIDQVSKHIIEFMKKNYQNQLIERYKLTKIDDLIEIYNEIAKKTGNIHAGEVDYEKVESLILKDLREGRLGKVTFDLYEN